MQHKYSMDILFILILFYIIPHIFCFQCDRTPENILRPRDKNNIDRYIIEISGNPDSYVPGENYTITLKLNPVEQSKRYFKHFTLLLENLLNEQPINVIEQSQFLSTSSISNTNGNFYLLDPTMTKFSQVCANTVMETNSLPKSIVQISWVAPPTKSGCISIKATVVENKYTWYADDGLLTRILCEEVSENEDVQPPIIKHCCACDEAKYELAFEGMWSRNTHPKNFPNDLFQTKFSELIGSSHKLHYSFWKYNSLASEGLRILAENGNTKVLESEIKEQSENIRTIIKARELSYPNITSTTYTVFRVDNENHLVSIVSKIIPSPDWIVGVANLELCLKNCSWVESRILNLYPWDIGTDSGLSYLSSDEPSTPRHLIRKITSNSPNDPRSPFYDENGEPVKPLARLHFTRQKLYEKNCDSILSSTDDNDNEEFYDEDCATTEWSEWSPCSNCFMYRQRSLINKENSAQCDKQLTEKKYCPCREVSPDDSRCELGTWSQWSSCSANCGKGTKTRDRQLLQPEYEALCNNNGALILQENEECDGEFCGAYSESNNNNYFCPNTTWDEWSPCNVTCGTGYKIRNRIPLTENENEFVEEDETCANEKLTETVECYQPPCRSEEVTEYPWGGINSGNYIRSTALSIISEEPVGPVLNCKVSKWSAWSGCNTTEPCKRGYKYKTRYIKVHPLNGGTPCPKKLYKKKRCKTSCSTTNSESNDRSDVREFYPTWGPAQPDDVRIDCEMSPWSSWSPCSANCGLSIQQRTRIILRYPSKNGMPCAARKEERKCSIPLTCSDKL